MRPLHHQTSSSRVRSRSRVPRRSVPKVYADHSPRPSQVRTNRVRGVSSRLPITMGYPTKTPNFCVTYVLEK